MDLTRKTIDLNCDVGEGYSDELLFPYISSCNIACGGHYGDEQTMRKTIQSALKHKVAIGAHPAYPDKENFGRKVMALPIEKLLESLSTQLNAFISICKELNTKPTHIKTHGALYNKMASNKNFSRAIFELFQSILPKATIYCLAESAAQSAAQEMNIPFLKEGFSDRAYTLDKILVSRSINGAVLYEWSQIESQLDGLLSGLVRTIDNKEINLKVDSLCLHGDTRGAALLSKKIYAHVKSKGYEVCSYRST